MMYHRVRNIDVLGPWLQVRLLLRICSCLCSQISGFLCGPCRGSMLRAACWSVHSRLTSSVAVTAWSAVASVSWHEAKDQVMRPEIERSMLYFSAPMKADISVARILRRLTGTSHARQSRAGLRLVASLCECLSHESHNTGILQGREWLRGI